MLELQMPTINHPPFYNLSRALPSGLIAANLGASNDRGVELPAPIRQLITLIELDANAGSLIPDNHYRSIIRIRKGIAGSPGLRDFHVAGYPGASSLLGCDQDLVKQYGMERFLQVAQTRQVECTTITQILDDHHLDGIDFLKTDLEGLDFEVIKSCRHLFHQIVAIQAELRFQPFYDSEPSFHEVAGFLASHGYELVGLKVESWKYNTAHRDRQRKGRAVWADAVFFKSPALLLANPSDPTLLIKQIIAAIMLRHENYAQMLLEQYRNELPPSCISDLDQLLLARLSPKSEVMSQDFPHAAFE